MKTINKFNTSAVSPHMQDWSLIGWKKINEYVKKLRQRIFRAEQLGQRRKVRKLQRLMIRSKANLLLSIKRITQINKGKKTAGVDGEVEPLKINQIVPSVLGGVECYDNLELLHQSCYRRHLKLLEKYGEGKDLPRIVNHFKNNQVEPNSEEGYKLMKKEFVKFKYQLV
ncbi:hypothetical protein WY13_02746 [Clostridium ljungdahlii]|uniref:Reverse transcriptase N-terminal domain-containing protein n=1 Tax=Clostridium ljungdahlii TaxID=1538 RepID=A0A168ML34_9CLOT|nr:hypothetical protein WY13_02746 [Clostridium ljungdahlii]